MTDKEKIRAEIERLYDGEVPEHDQQCDFGDGYFYGLATISNFIDSLPEEGFATVNLVDGDYDDGLRVHESTKSVYVSYKDVKDLRQRLEVVDSISEEKRKNSLQNS